jgi:hypothetical protein
VSDIQDVVLHALLDAPAPKWLSLHVCDVQRGRPGGFLQREHTTPWRRAVRSPQHARAAPLQAPVPRVVVLMLNGLDWHTWSQQQGTLACLRDSFQPPVRVYGTSPHATTGAGVRHDSGRDALGCAGALRVSRVPCRLPCHLPLPTRTHSPKRAGVHDVPPAVRNTSSPRWGAARPHQAAVDCAGAAYVAPLP